MADHFSISNTKFKVLLGVQAAFFALLFSGCGVEVVDAKNAEKPPVAEPVSPEPTSPEYQLLPLEQPNQYQIRFRADLQPRLRSARPSGDNSEGVQISEASVFQGGLTYNFKFQKPGSSDYEEKAIEIPKDLVFNQVTRHAQKSKVWKIESKGRIFLQSGAILINEDEDLLLVAPEVISQGATLRTFDSEVTVTSDGKTGRSSGNIEIRAQRVSGPLSVDLRGEDGHKGIAGEEYKEKAPDRVLPPGLNNIRNCQEASKGQPGYPGARGRKGGHGGSGGNAGNFTLKALDAADFRIDVRITAGNKGVGGNGGRGQTGGRGEPSNRSNLPLFNFNENQLPVFCPQIPEFGEPGETGPNGDQGDDGHDGSRGKDCRLVTGGQLDCK